MKKFFVFAALILITSTVVFGQAMTNWESPQSAATQGRYRSAADNFIRPDAYAGVTFNKFYAMTSFRDRNRAQLGYATKIGDLYLGAAYGGKFWADTTKLNYQETLVPDWAGGTEFKKVPVYTDGLNFITSGSPENRIAILLGVANMGFRLTFSSTHERINLKDDFALSSTAVSGYDYYKSWEAERGAITPQLAWSMTKGLTENGIQPWVTIDLGFVRNYRKQEKYDDTVGIERFNGIEVVSSSNYVEPIFALGFGGYTVYKNDSNFRLTADLDYTLRFRVYDNEYSYEDSNGDFKTKTIKGLNTGTNLTKNTYSYNEITPSIAAQWSGGPLALRLKLNMVVPLTSEETTPMTIIDESGGALASGPTTKAFTVGFNPNLRLAAQWKINPKFTLNAGGRINLYAGNQITSETDGYKKVTEKDGVATANQLSLGLTILPTDNLSFEVSSTFGTTNNINVFSTSTTDGGLFILANFLVGLKF